MHRGSYVDETRQFEAQSEDARSAKGRNANFILAWRSDDVLEISLKERGSSSVVLHLLYCIGLFPAVMTSRLSMDRQSGGSVHGNRAGMRCIPAGVYPRIAH